MDGNATKGPFSSIGTPEGVPFQARTFDLDQIPLTVHKAVTDAEHRFIPSIHDRMILEIKCYLAGKPWKHVVRYPKTWWHAFKLRFYPEWLLRRYPVVYTEVTLTSAMVLANAEDLRGLRRPMIHLPLTVHTREMCE